MLFPLFPKRPGTAPMRAMLVVEELWQVLTSPVGDLAWEKRVAELRATLERFVEGHTIDPKYLFLLYPTADAVWEIRCTREDPSIRVLGLFAAKDVFVATHYELRENLGGWESREWKNVKKRAKARWRILFNTYPPICGARVGTLVSGAADGKYIRGA